MRKSIVYLSVLFVSYACTSKKAIVETTKETPNEVILPSFTLEEEGEEVDLIKERSVYRASETRINDLIHTKLEVSFDWKKQYLNGKAYLTLKPFFYNTDSLTLDAKGFTLNKVELITKSGNKELKYNYDGNFIRIKLDKTYHRSEEYKIFVDYVAKPNDLKLEGSSAIAEAKGLYFINPLGEDPNKMPQIWTQGETEASSCWFPTIDAPNEKTTQEIYITVNDKFKTLSNGKLIYGRKNADGTRTDYWKQDLPHTPYLFMMAVGEFSVVEDSWTRPNGEKMMVNYYVEKEWEQYAKDIFGETPRMIGFFSNLLGVDYPWDKYHQIVVRDYVSGAMENTSAVIHGDFLYRTDRELLDANNESIIAHELFHHWFGDLVTCESWSNLPMNESFANYSQYLWDEYAHGKMEADMNAYQEMNGYFLSSAQSGYHDLIWFDYDNKEDMFDGHSYNKGGRILNMLRNYLGDSAFFKSLNYYLTDRKFKSAEVHNLRLAFEEVSGQDLNWFFNQWFFASRHPELTFKQEWNETSKTLTVKISQNQNLEKAPLYKLPMDIDVYVGAKATTYPIVVDKSEQEFSFQLASKPDLVNVDARKVLLCKKNDVKPDEQWIHQLKFAPLWLDKKEAFENCSKNDSDEAMKAILSMLDHDFWDVKTMAMKASKEVSKKYPEELKSKLINLAKNDTKANVRESAIKYLYKYFSEDSTLNDVYEIALKDKSYGVMSEALKVISKTDSERALRLASNLESENSSDIKVMIASIYAQSGTAANNEFFIKTAPTLSGFVKYGFLQNYQRYLSSQDEKLLETAIPLYKEVAENGGAWWMKMNGYQNLFTIQTKYEDKIKAIESGDDNTELEYYKNQKSKIDQLIETLKENESDTKVRDMLGLN